MAMLWNFSEQGSHINKQERGVLYKLLYKVFPSFTFRKNDRAVLTGALTFGGMLPSSLLTKTS